MNGRWSPKLEHAQCVSSISYCSDEIPNKRNMRGEEFVHSWLVFDHRGRGSTVEVTKLRLGGGS